MTVRVPGFADVTRSVTLTVGAAFDMTVSLALASLQTDIGVSEQQEVLETARTQIAGTISQEVVKDLPVIWRAVSSEATRARH